MKNQKGITLIALVITIIVMLILVGVTISVSLNGGLFITAKESTTQMDIAQEKEELLMSAMGALGEDGKVDFSKLDNNLPDNFTKIADKTYESSTGNKYQVAENGNIILLDGDVEEEPETPGCQHNNTTTMNQTNDYSGDIYCNDCNQIIQNGYILNHKGTIPEGGTYYVGVTSTTTGDYTGATAIYKTGDTFPTTINDGDVYTFGDYEYRYNMKYGQSWSNFSGSEYDPIPNGWGVRVIDNTKNTYGAILESINNVQIKTLYNTFVSCKNLLIPPQIPSGTEIMWQTYGSCSSIKSFKHLNIPSGVKELEYVFRNCDSLTNDGLPIIPNSIISLERTFEYCDSITSLNGFTIPNSVTSLNYTFQYCKALEDISGFKINSSIETMLWTFAYCDSLLNTPDVSDATGLEMVRSTFYNCVSLNDVSQFNIPTTTIQLFMDDGVFNGCTNLVDASVMTLPANVWAINSMFSGCTSLKYAPIIPSKVNRIYFAFYNCTALTGSVVINSSAIDTLNDNHVSCFKNVDFEAQNLTLSGSSSKLDTLGATGTNYCSTCNGKCLNNH